MLCQGQRGILEWRFPHPGRYMFHAHQSEFTELGWQGFFEVVRERQRPSRVRPPAGTTVMEAQATPATWARPPPLPAWLLGLVPLLIIAGALGRVRAARRPRARRAARSAGRGARGRADRAASPGIDRADRAQRRSRRGDRSRRRRSTTRSCSSPAPRTRSAGWPAATVAPRSSRGSRARPTRSRCVTSTGGTIAHEIPVAVETPDDRPRLLRADGAARRLRRASSRSRSGCCGCRGCGASPPAGCACVMALTVGLLGVPGRSTPRSRALELAGRGLAGVRRRRPGVPRRARSPTCCSPACRRVAGHRRRARRGRRLAACAGAARRGRHRPAQPRRGRGHRLRLRRRARSRSGAFLVVGFALHNTTEGLAIVAPIGAPAPAVRAAGRARADRRRARRAGRVDRRGGVQRQRWPRSCSASAPGRSSR